MSRDVRYTRYVSHDVVLRTHSTAHIPQALRELASDPVDDVLLVSPGIVYRRDSIDRIHTGTPHQVDLWRVRRGKLLAETDLDTMALDLDAEWVETVEIVDLTPPERLPPSAIERLGLVPGQMNALIRMTLRHPTRTLTDHDANALRDRIAEGLRAGYSDAAV